VASGYSIQTKFEYLYRRSLENRRFEDMFPGPIYGVPLLANGLTDPGVCYRGIYRQPLDCLSYESARAITAAVGRTWDDPHEGPNPATVLLREIELATGREDGWVTSRDDILRVWNRLGDLQADYEVIFAREYNDNTPTPEGAAFLGCDVAYFVSNHFSCICDCMFLPVWHGTDPEGVLFRDFYDSLNENGLFGTSEMALRFLDYYLSFDWTERSDNFTSIEVHAVTP
jgi:hypothetical protein